jgi:hypothetical protein
MADLPQHSQLPHTLLHARTFEGDPVPVLGAVSPFWSTFGEKCARGPPKTSENRLLNLVRQRKRSRHVTRSATIRFCRTPTLSASSDVAVFNLPMSPSCVCSRGKLGQNIWTHALSTMILPLEPPRIAACYTSFAACVVAASTPRGGKVVLHGETACDHDNSDDGGGASPESRRTALAALEHVKEMGAPRKDSRSRGSNAPLSWVRCAASP